jgi:TatD DNase family protein
MQFFDSHAHLTLDEKYYSGADDIILRAKEENVSKINNVCSDLYALEKGLELIKKHENIYLSAGIAPHNSEKNLEQFQKTINQAIKDKKLIALGEIGLDYFYDYVDKKTQKKIFTHQLELAKKNNLPVIIHIRDAFDDFFEIVDEYFKDQKLLLHCFTGNINDAKKIIDRNYYISFSGIVTFKNALAIQEALKIVPLNRILIETDSPFLSPQSKRGKTNEPKNIIETASVIAKLKNVSLEDVANNTFQNALDIFNLS